MPISYVALSTFVPKPKNRSHFLFSVSFGVSLVPSLVFLYRPILMSVISLPVCLFVCFLSAKAARGFYLAKAVGVCCLEAHPQR